MQTIRKAIFPFCGFDAEHLPAAKAIPLEMFPVINVPLIQHTVDEARQAGIEEFIFVIGRNKSVVEKHFYVDYESDGSLKKSASTSAADGCQIDPLDVGQAVFLRQRGHAGIGNAILQARDYIGNEPFAVLSPTKLIKSDTPCIRQLLNVKRNVNEAVLAVESVPAHNISKRTAVDQNIIASGQMRVTDLVDRPTSDDLQSKLAVVDRYILPPTIFQILEDLKTVERSKIRLNDAIRVLAAKEMVLAKSIEGTSFDCSRQPGFIAANMIYALDQISADQDLTDELIRTGVRSKIERLLDANALTELTQTLGSIGQNA